ncbi:MAG TPA: hypothetical protein HA257_06900, partial [Candidatus Methanoperedenaceae archaeon]|nr:hypothetical protein [Candidatus Methanoperedenaceae archaeon]
MNKGIAVTLILLLALASGCIETVPQATNLTGDPGSYELAWLSNYTTFYVNLTLIKVVHTAVNTTHLNVSLESQTGPIEIYDVVVVDYYKDPISFDRARRFADIRITHDPSITNVSNAAFETKIDARMLYINISSPVTGFIAYSESAQPRTFAQMIESEESVRVVLPAGYTTGNKLLGAANPPPDYVAEDSEGREVLIWNSPYPDTRFITVDYYPDWIPGAFMY